MECGPVRGYEMDKLNKLTQRLFSKGYTKENYPDDVRPFVPFYGGFTYRPETLYRLVFETPCGLLVKGSHFVTGTMSFMGIDWMPENDNPVVVCPYFTGIPCEQNHPLLWERRGEIRHCACHLTDQPYSYEQSLEKAHAKVWEEADALFEAFRIQKQGRACKYRSRYDRMEKQWRMFYDPIDCAREGFCNYCDVLQSELSPKKGNVFYDVKISRTQKGVGLFPDETVVSIIKGKKLLDSSASLTLCEAIVRCCGAQIQESEENRSFRERFFDPTYTVEVQNIRAERQETRDLLQDLWDAAEGIEIVHAGDMQKAAAQKKRERKQAAQKRKIARLERLLLENGLDKLEKADQRRIKKVLPAERIEELILQRQAPPSTAEQLCFYENAPLSHTQRM